MFQSWLILAGVQGRTPQLQIALIDVHHYTAHGKAAQDRPVMTLAESGDRQALHRDV